MDHYQLLIANACSDLSRLFFWAPLGLLFTYMLFVYQDSRFNKMYSGIMLLSLVPIVFLFNKALNMILPSVVNYWGDKVGQDLIHSCANMVLFVATVGYFFLIHILLVFQAKRSRQKVSNLSVPKKSVRHVDPYTHSNLRHGALHYLLGRGAAGIAGFATILLLVRFMNVTNYAIYTSLSGLVVLCCALPGLGMERVVSRFVPEGRLYRPVKDLSRFIWIISAVRLSAVLLIVLLLYIFWTDINRFLNIAEFEFFPIGLLCFIVGVAMFEHFSAILQSLIMQKTLTRLMVIQWAGRLLLIVGVIFMNGKITWEDTLWICAIPELCGVVGFVVVIKGHLRDLSDPEETKSSGESWPAWRRVAEVGLNNYGFTLLATPPQGYFMKVLSAAYLTEEIVAAYGFCISMAEKVRQYIPLHFFYGMLEPMMIASYLKDRNFPELSYRCQLLYKSNLLLMVPMIAWVAVAGDVILSLLTGGKFQGLSWILLLIMTQLTVGSHVVLLQLILNTLGKSKLLISASLIALATMMIAIAITLSTKPVYLLCTPLLFSAVMNLYIVLNLAGSNFVYKPSWQMLWSIIFSGLVSFALTIVILSQAQSWQLGAVVMSVASLAAVIIGYAIALWLMKVIRKSEVLLVKSLIIGN